MSFFSGDQKQGNTNAWGGFFKQAISSVETRFDNLLEQDSTGSSTPTKNEISNDEEIYTDTYVDPITGMVTSVQRTRPKKPITIVANQSAQASSASPIAEAKPKSSDSPTNARNSSSDLSARLAAVMADRNSRTPSPSQSGRSTPKPLDKIESKRVSATDSTTREQETTKAENESGTAPKADEEEDKAKEIMSLENENGNTPKTDQEEEKSKATAEQEVANEVIDVAKASVNMEKDLKEVPVSDATDIQKAEDNQQPEENIDDALPIDKSEDSDTGLTEFGTEASELKAAENDRTDAPEKSTLDNEANEAELDPVLKVNGENEVSPAGEENAESVEVEATIPEFKDEEEDTDNANNLLSESPKNDPKALEEVSQPTITLEDSSDGDEKWNAIIRQREEQVLNVMRANADLHEQMHQQQETSDAEIARLKAKVDELVSTKSGNRLVDDLRSQLAAKDAQLKDLMLEGEALSKRELKHMNALKKLRAEKSESDKSQQELQKKIDKGASDLVEANAKIARMMESERKNNESMKSYSANTNKQQKAIAKLEKNLEEVKDELKASQTQVEQLKKELQEIKESGEKESNAAHAAALEKELKANDRLHKELTEVRSTAEETERKLKQNIRELQVALQTVEEKAGYREDNLRQDIATLQKRLQAAEASYDEVHANMDDSTQPLLRQIEVLQAKVNELMRSRDDLERGFISQLQEAKSLHAQSSANEVQLEKAVAEHREKATSWQQQIYDLQQKLDLSENELKVQKASSEETMNKLTSLENDIKRMQQQHLVTLEEERQKFELNLKQQLDEAREKWEETSRQERARATSIGSPLGRNKRQNSFVANWVNDNNDESRANRFGYEQSSPVTSNRSSFDSSPHTGPVASSSGPPTVLIERLNATIRQLEGQNQLYQMQAQQSAQSRDELAEELIKLSRDIDELREESKAAEQLKNEHEGLNQRYHAALEMLGERTEQVEELKADIADVKEMYRNQIVELVQKIDQLSKS
ncbi:hypothetical protein NQZ79_g1836 [Umbelopsis isabellina]|nr:hypothetical protein NQZ79_g1836 [Umbelopsis isabellina]